MLLKVMERLASLFADRFSPIRNDTAAAVALKSPTALTALPEAQTVGKPDEQTFPVVAVLTKGSLLDFAGDQPVYGSVKNKVSGQIQYIFKLLDLLFEQIIFIAKSDETLLQLSQGYSSVVKEPFGKQFMHFPEAVELEHNLALMRILVLDASLHDLPLYRHK